MPNDEERLQKLAHMRAAAQGALLLADDIEDILIAIKFAECLDLIDKRVRLMTN